MKIAQVASLAESVPPKLYGGIERVVHYLTEELIKQGHSVTLFASGDSKTNNLKIGNSRCDFEIYRHQYDVGFNILYKPDDWEMIIKK